MTSSPEPECWLSPLARIDQSVIDGRGLFAAEPIAHGTVISRFGGRLVTDAGLHQLFADAAATGTYVDTLSIGEDLNLVLPPGVPHHAGNHSCTPNTWWADPCSVIARRDIDGGEELTLDYATITDDPGFEMPCRCRTSSCRGRITGMDWQLARLQVLYAQHWVPILSRRIAGS